MGAFKNKFAREKISVGIDIGTHSVKAVKLKVSMEAAELIDFDLWPVASDLSHLLKQVAQEHNLKSVNISLSGLSALIRYISFHKMNYEELKQALKFEAQKHIPFPINEVNIDVYILKDDLPDGRMLVLLAAVKKELINKRLKVLEDAGLKVNLVDLDSISLINAFCFSYAAEIESKYKLIALLNVGSEMSNLNILEGNSIPRFSRDIHIAGRNFSQKIADILGMDFNSAEILKISPEKEMSEKLKTAIDPAFINLANEIRTSFDYYESQSTASVEKIFLSGGGAKFFAFKDMLANFLGIEPEYWDPFKKISLTSGIDSEKLKESSQQLAVAAGLALRQ